MIRNKLILWNCVVLSLLLAAIGAAIYFFTRQSMLNAVDANLLSRATYSAKTYQGPQDAASLARARARLPKPISPSAARQEGMDDDELRQLRIQRIVSASAIRFGLDGKGVVDPEERPRRPDGFKGAQAGQTTIGDSNVEGEPSRTVDIPLVKDGKILEISEYSATLSPVFAELGRLETTLLIVLPSAVVVMFLVGAFLTKRALKPVSEITAAAEQIGAGNLEGRLPVQSEDEFGHLSKTFNSMLNRLEQAFHDKDEAYRRQKDFTADASHELKSPLTAIRTRAEIALRKDLEPAKYREHLQAIDRAAKSMSALVHDLLLLTTSDVGRAALLFENTAVKDIVEDAVGSVDPLDRKLDIKVPDSLSIKGNRMALTRVLSNLLDNAVRHTPEGGRIQLEAAQHHSRVDICVKDEGEGIPEEELPLIFDRFHRVDRSRDRDSGGTGLGLAIAKAITEAHGGSISIESKIKKGTIVTVSLPLRG